MTSNGERALASASEPGEWTPVDPGHPLFGLAPRRTLLDTAVAERRQRSSMYATMPIVLVGTMALAGLTGPVQPVEAESAPRRDPAPEAERSVALAVIAANRAAQSAAAADAGTEIANPELSALAPRSYTVRSGDTVSEIAGRFGLSTAAVLALNGLSWKTVIHPGQVLRLTKAKPASSAPTTASPSGTYTVRSGDTVSAIASRHGLSTSAVLAANRLTSRSIIFPGQKLVLPGRSTSAVPTPPATPPASTTPPTPTTPAPATPAPTSGRYTIKSGDTLTSIARKFGITLSALLSTNSLTGSSIIYAGRTLAIPGLATTEVGTSFTPLSPEMSANAAVIIAVGRERGVPDYGIIIALATAMQESSLRNLSYGDLDSVGLFQQRPSAGWGSKTQLLNTTYAAQLFYGGPRNPNRGVTRGLLDVAGWQSMTLTQAAQKVQISAFPNAYAKWETSARAWFDLLG